MAEQRDTILPRFYRDKRLNNFQSEQMGRPVYDDVEMVEMVIPGDRNAMPVTFVRQEHRERWPTQYAAFKAGLEPVMEGSPLEEWPPLSPATVANLKGLGLHTVEHLAGLSDIHGPKIGLGWRDLRDKAEAWLENARTGEPLARVTAENEQLKARIAVLEQNVTDLMTHLPQRQEVQA